MWTGNSIRSSKRLSFCIYGSVKVTFYNGPRWCGQILKCVLHVQLATVLAYLCASVTFQYHERWVVLYTPMALKYSVSHFVTSLLQSLSLFLRFNWALCCIKLLNLPVSPISSVLFQGTLISCLATKMKAALHACIEVGPKPLFTDLTSLLDNHIQCQHAVQWDVLPLPDS
jgi:hypothetical protein